MPQPQNRCPLPDEDQDRRALFAYWSLTDRLRNIVNGLLGGTWRALPDLHDPTVTRWASRGGIQLDMAQAHVAAATAAYLAATAPGSNRQIVSVPATMVTSQALRGVPADELLHRAPEQAWYGLSEGEEFDEAKERGTLRILGLIAAGMQLSHTHAARHVMSRRGVQRYRRATRAGACDLCSMSARQTYSTSDLLPIHVHCHCVVVPVWGGKDLPGPELSDQERYETEVAIEDHGELGPVLTQRGQHFRGASDIP